MTDSHGKNCDISLDECIIWEVRSTISKHCFPVNSRLRCGEGNYCFFNKTKDAVLPLLTGMVIAEQNQAQQARIGVG